MALSVIPAMEPPREIIPHLRSVEIRGRPVYKYMLSHSSISWNRFPQWTHNFVSVHPIRSLDIEVQQEEIWHESCDSRAFITEK